MNSKILFAILTWDHLTQLKLCIASIKPYLDNQKNFDLLVIDNGSADKTPEWLSQNYLKSQVVRLPKNMGVAAGYNHALRFAIKQGYDYVVLVDDDVLIHALPLQKIVDFMNADPKIGLIIPKIYADYQNRKLWSMGGKLVIQLAQPFHHGLSHIDKGQYQNPVSVDYSPKPWMLGIKTVEKIGFFDESYGLYGFEDLDYCVKIKKAGYAIMAEPAFICEQNPLSSITRNNPGYDYWMTRNRLLFAKQLIPLLPFCLFFLPYFIMRRVIVPSLAFLFTFRIKRIWFLFRGIKWHFLNPDEQRKLDSLIS